MDVMGLDLEPTEAIVTLALCVPDSSGKYEPVHSYGISDLHHRRQS